MCVHIALKFYWSFVLFCICIYIPRIRIRFNQNHNEPSPINCVGHLLSDSYVFAVCRWVTGSISRAQYAAVAEYYEFFPLVCLMSNYEADEELSKTCVSMLAMMGQALTLPQHIPVVLQSVSRVSDSLSSAMAQASHHGGPGSV